MNNYKINVYFNNESSININDAVISLLVDMICKNFHCDVSSSCTYLSQNEGGRN